MVSMSRLLEKSDLANNLATPALSEARQKLETSPRSSRPTAKDGPRVRAGFVARTIPPACKRNREKRNRKHRSSDRIRPSKRHRALLRDTRRGRTAGPAPRRRRSERDVWRELAGARQEQASHRRTPASSRAHRRRGPPHGLRGDGRRHRGPDRTPRLREIRRHGLLTGGRRLSANGHPPPRGG